MNSSNSDGGIGITSNSNSIININSSSSKNNNNNPNTTIDMVDVHINTNNNNSNDNMHLQHRRTILNTTSAAPASGLTTSSQQQIQIQAPDSVLSKVPSSTTGASCNLINAIVGAGIIGIPFAFQQSGLCTGIVLLLIVGYLTHISLCMLIDCSLFHPLLSIHGTSNSSSSSSSNSNNQRHQSHIHGIYTYEDLISIPYGKMGYQFVLASMFIMAYGAMIAYMIIIKDTIPKVLGFTSVESTFLQKEGIMILTSICIILPLALIRDISMLSYTSTVSVLADIALVAIIVYYSPIQSSLDEYKNNEDSTNFIQDFVINSQLFIGLGILSTAMACQHSAFLISGSLNPSTTLSSTIWSSVSYRSISLSTLLTLLFGIFGYLGYLHTTQGNVLNNFPETSIAINAGRALLGITMYLTYPMESIVARHVIIQLFYNGNMDNTSIHPVTGEVQPETNKWCCGYIGRREYVTILLFITTLIPAIIVDDLGPVLSITGSLGASCIAYIGPGIVYIGVHGQQFLSWADGGPISNGNSGSTDDTQQYPKDTELPIVGDATARISTTATPYESSSSPTNKHRRRSWDWYIVGMPLWTAIAKRGERGTREYLIDRDNTNNTHYHNTTNAMPEVSDEFDHGLQHHHRDIIYPTAFKFRISIVMILFGCMAIVCGVISNIYFELKNIFYTPT